MGLQVGGQFRGEPDHVLPPVGFACAGYQIALELDPERSRGVAHVQGTEELGVVETEAIGVIGFAGLLHGAEQIVEVPAHTEPRSIAQAVHALPDGHPKACEHPVDASVALVAVQHTGPIAQRNGVLDQVAHLAHGLQAQGQAPSVVLERHPHVQAQQPGIVALYGLLVRAQLDQVAHAAQFEIGAHHARVSGRVGLEHGVRVRDRDPRAPHDGLTGRGGADQIAEAERAVRRIIPALGDRLCRHQDQSQQCGQEGFGIPARHAVRAGSVGGRQRCRF